MYMMAIATLRLVIASVAFAAPCVGSLRSASAEGLDHEPFASQPFELWSKASSGLGALESRCESLARAPWRVQETVDPWATPAAYCAPTPATRFDPHATLEIIDPWPFARADFTVERHEIIDPWPSSVR